MVISNDNNELIGKKSYYELRLLQGLITFRWSNVF